MFTHNLDPIIFQFGFLSIRWYSLAYILGILLGWYYGKKILINRQKIEKNEFEIKEFDNLITYLILSIIIGGRIGYIFFYNFEYYFQNPSDIFKIWEGGMSFHGALIGIIVGTVLFSKKQNIKTFYILDVLACVSPIGLFFGRIANFINGELIGKVTSVSWSVIFPKIDMMPRHPSQLYQAIFEGIFLYFIMNYIISREDYKTGTCSSLFLIFYGCFRIFTEIFREPDKQIGYLFGIFSMGTILSIAMLITGFIMFLVLKKKNEI